MTYQYNKPRRLNIVSFLMLIAAAAGGYAGWKFIPVYWQARKVDQILDEEKMAGASFHRMKDELRPGVAEQIVAKAVTRIYELGVEDVGEQPLQVWFSPDWTELNAKYQVVVRHPVGEPTVLTMERKVDVPRD